MFDNILSTIFNQAISINPLSKEVVIIKFNSIFVSKMIKKQLILDRELLLP